MKNLLRPLLALGAVALLAPFVAAQPLPVKTVEFKSEAVGRTLKYNIVLPTKYEQSTDRYPVLYLLHGLGSNYTAWARMGVPEYARAYDLIVVMVDGGNSWYVNWAKSDEGQKNNWEDCIVKDLIGHVDTTYRTIAKREGRAINGLSMGGFGGLVLGLRHPDMFCSIGSHSGALHYAKAAGDQMAKGRGNQAKGTRGPPSNNPIAGINVPGFSSAAERTPKGTMFASAADAAAYDPFQLALKVPIEKMPHIYIDCGTEDGLIQHSVALAKLLAENHIPYTYAQSAGGHNAPYWTREVGHSMAVQYSIIQRSLAAARRTASGAPGGN